MATPVTYDKHLAEEYLSPPLTIDLNSDEEPYPLVDRVVFTPDNRLIVNFIGAPGSGKGTQASFLRKEIPIAHLSMGDIFRTHMRTEDDLGALINHHISRRGAALVPEELTLGMIVTKITQANCTNGFLLDGFPRSKAQAESLANVLLHPNDLHIIVYFDLKEDIILQRMKKPRYICKDCGYQIGAHALKEEKKEIQCKECHSINVQPREESEEKMRAFAIRIREFEENKASVLEALGKKHQIHHLQLSGEELPEEVFEKVKKIVHHRMKVYAIRNK